MMPAQMVLPESVVVPAVGDGIRLKGAVRPYCSQEVRRPGWMRKEARPFVLTLFTPGGIMALRLDDKKALVAEVAAVAATAQSVVAAEYRGLRSRR